MHSSECLRILRDALPRGLVVLPRRRSCRKWVQQRHGPSAAGRGACEGPGLVCARQHVGDRFGPRAGLTAAAHLGRCVQCKGALEMMLTRTSCRARLISGVGNQQHSLPEPKTGSAGQQLQTTASPAGHTAVWYSNACCACCRCSQQSSLQCLLVFARRSLPLPELFAADSCVWCHSSAAASGFARRIKHSFAIAATAGRDGNVLQHVSRAAQPKSRTAGWDGLRRHQYLILNICWLLSWYASL